MKQPRQSQRAPTQQSSGSKDAPTRLSQCGETLGIVEYCGVLGMSRADYFRRKAHRDLPVKPLKGFRNRFSAIQVQRFLERGA